MNSFLNLLWVVLLALVSCTSRDEVQSSPFSGTGSISHQGILGSLLIRADGIADVSQYPEPFRDLLTDDCRIQITLLDPDILSMCTLFRLADLFAGSKAGLQ